MTKHNNPGNTMVGSITRTQATIGLPDRFPDIGVDHLVEVVCDLPITAITTTTTRTTMVTTSHTPVNTLMPRII